MRLVDADKIEKFIQEGLNNPDKLKAFGYDAVEILTEVHYAPTIDAEVVVRCEACKHSKPIDTKQAPFRYYKPECLVCYCEEVVGDEPMVYHPTHFCSYGERRADHGTESH